MAIETKKRDHISDEKMNVDDNLNLNPNVLIEEEEEEENDKELEINDNMKMDAESETEFDDESSTAVSVTNSNSKSKSNSKSNSKNINRTKALELKSKSQSKGQSQVQFSPELLSQYYSRLFPFTLLSQWLSYSTSALASTSTSTLNSTSTSTTNGKLFSHREFSFTIEPVPGDEIYIRYQSFKSQQEFTNAVLKRQPRKIDIGAIFSHPPKDHHTIQSSNSNSASGGTGAKFQPQQRELVFDIDLTDYDEVRKCGCAEANICNICWKMMGMAVKVMDEGLREDFGFRNICWFYSGRRGVHCWVCDESARTLSDAGRSAVASYFEVSDNSRIRLMHSL
jgi:DNA primase small subunit